LRVPAAAGHDGRVDLPGQDSSASPTAGPGSAAVVLPGWADSARYLALTTFRRNGAAVTTPVWFAADGGRLLVWTSPSSGKAKRLRANPAVTIAPCSVRGQLLGPAVDATAILLPDSAARLVQDQLNAKYGLVKRIYDATMGVSRAIRRRPPQQSASIEIRAAAARP
jgi:uncharacterized protein